MLRQVVVDLIPGCFRPNELVITVGTINIAVYGPHRNVEHVLFGFIVDQNRCTASITKQAVGVFGKRITSNKVPSRNVFKLLACDTRPACERATAYSSTYRTMTVAKVGDITVHMILHLPTFTSTGNHDALLTVQSPTWIGLPDCTKSDLPTASMRVGVDTQAPSVSV